MMKRYLIIVAVLLTAFVHTADAQKVAVKSNLLYWGTTTPNAGVEIAIAERWTVELASGYNPWTLDRETNQKAKHWLVSPEVRYWFCESFHGHFVGINANYAQFNVGAVPVPEVFITIDSNAPEGTRFVDARNCGWAVGAGITYGYQFIIAPRWNLELTAGLGWWYTEYDRFESRKCGMFQQEVYSHAVGPTSLGISFIYLIK